jgi:ABC-2 type transport system ATP-binding protein
VTEENGHITAVPKKGESIAAEVLAVAQKNGWTVNDLKVNEGRLDDVFRRLTTTEDTQKEVA